MSEKKRGRKPKTKGPIDRRTVWSRRHKELTDAFAADLGAKLSAADLSLVDSAATVAVACERLKVQQLNDEPIDFEQLVRLTNSLTRLAIELGKRKDRAVANAKPKTFEERMAAMDAKPRRVFDENDF